MVNEEVAKKFFMNTYKNQPEIITAVLGMDATEVAFHLGETKEVAAD